MDKTVASLVDEGQNSVSRIIRQETKTDLLPPNAREDVEENGKRPKKQCFSHQKQ